MRSGVLSARRIARNKTKFCGSVPKTSHAVCYYILTRGEDQMDEKVKQMFENQPPVPYSVVSNMDDSDYDEDAALFFEETGALGEAYRLYKINDFKDGRDTLVIPSEVNGKPVVEIGSCVGICLHIRNLYIPSSVKVIEDYAFDCGDFETLVIDGVEEICKRAFALIDVKTLVLGEGIKEIGEGAFHSAHEESLVLPDSLETIRNATFKDNLSLKTIRFGKG